MKTFLVTGLAVLLLGPLLLMIGVGVIANPAISYTALCGTTRLSVVADVPNSLSATSADGRLIVLNKQQLTRARTIILVGTQTASVGQNGILIGLMAALTESGLRQLANPSAYPESATYPNDGTGSDHDSLGLFQMRPQSGWGTVAELMDPAYQARAFFGGPSGPNHGSPRGLLDVPGWQQMSLGRAVQSVEISAFPDRYANYEPVARSILKALTAPPPAVGPADSTLPETTSLVFPLPEGNFTVTDGFGPRTDPISGAQSFHAGTDFAAPDGTPIMAIADGRVTFAGMDGGTQGRITIVSTIEGQVVAISYLHMWSTGIFVHPGDWVAAGQQIGQVGSSGHSTGPHLHLEIHPGGQSAAAVDPQPWLAAHHLTTLNQPGAGGAVCSGHV
ncbi:M23 family metallopeptidase [Rathayibacter soli]|uniref:M23 family metallopeptidase n=1 Tax=Rathayibacter soli TaxID=3144168 RepID=UPI0027E474D4|nr:M23 family metallopeptidase [Glaciibacter superstes]